MPRKYTAFEDALNEAWGLFDAAMPSSPHEESVRDHIMGEIVEAQEGFLQAFLQDFFQLGHVE